MTIGRPQAGKQTRSAPSSRSSRKTRKVMREFKRGQLKSGSGKKVKDRKQAVAIALSQNRRGRRKR